MKPQEIVLTKEIQKTVLKALFEQPTFSIEELTLSLKEKEKNISQDEVFQSIQSLYPEKNWYSMTADERRKQILTFLFTLESQILFVLPAKQKENTVSDFNQFRLKNKQTKASKDIIRHLQSILMVDGKNLSKFRKFEKENELQNDIDANTQMLWAIRITFLNLNLEKLMSTQGLSQLLISEAEVKFPEISKKVGKTVQRITERFVERYFMRDLSLEDLKETISLFQEINKNYCNGVEVELVIKDESTNQTKLIHGLTQKIEDLKNIVNKSHEGGFLGKLFSGTLKNKEGILKGLEEILSGLNNLEDSGNSTNKVNEEKALIVQKLQSDYESVLLSKNQLEFDLKKALAENKTIEEKYKSVEKELQDITDSLEKSHEKLASQQRKVEQVPELENKSNILREELNFAKDISVRLYKRVNKLKAELLKVANEK